MGRHGTFAHLRAMCKDGANMGKQMRSNAMHNGTPELPGAMSKASWTSFMGRGGAFGILRAMCNDGANQRRFARANLFGMARFANAFRPCGTL